MAMIESAPAGLATTIDSLRKLRKNCETVEPLRFEATGGKHSVCCLGDLGSLRLASWPCVVMHCFQAPWHTEQCRSMTSSEPTWGARRGEENCCQFLSTRFWFLNGPKQPRGDED
ncbi:hypothetical protein J3459_016454 [Metarhizium acridum]|nr:hypothetical protein J3459_016454 [Metarhizium acridum]